MGRGHTNRVGYGRILRLLDRIGPVGRFDENTLGLYVFENFGQETKIQFEKSELNFEKSVGTQIYMAK